MKVYDLKSLSVDWNLHYNLTTFTGNHIHLSDLFVSPFDKPEQIQSTKY